LQPSASIFFPAMSLAESRQHSQVAQTLKRWMKSCSNVSGATVNPAKCDASLSDKHDSISAVSTALPSPVSSFEEDPSLHEADNPHLVEEDWEEWIAQGKSTLNFTSGEFRNEEHEKVLPRTCSECSDFWSKMQAELNVDADGFQGGLRSRAASADHSTDYDFRPMTPTAAAHAPTIPDEAELVRRNSELEDRVAELERKLLELAAQNGAA